MAADSDLLSKTVVRADFQELGRGQAGNHWHAEKGQNLLCSFFLKWENMASGRLPMLNYATSLSVCKALHQIGLKRVQVKWPNDVMCQGKKIAGILIENKINEGRIKESIIGIGLNVNQTQFPSYLPKATSVAICIGKSHDLDDLLALIFKKLMPLTAQMERGFFETIERRYLERLYLKNQWARFQDDKGMFSGMIKGVDAQGRLLVFSEHGQLKKYRLKEIKFLDERWRDASDKSA